MASEFVHFEGLDELDDLFAKLPIEIAQKVVDKSEKIAAKPLKEKIIAATPRVTGLLADSVKIRGSKSSDGQRIVTVGYAGGPYGGGKNDKAWYGGLIEFGHKVGKRPPGKKQHHYANDTRPDVPGEHIVEYAFDEMKNEIVTILEESLWAETEKAIERLKK